MLLFLTVSFKRFRPFCLFRTYGIMKVSGVYLAIALAVLVVMGVLWSGREKFGVPEFLDRSMEEKRRQGEVSSYAQTTNHLSSPGSMGRPESLPRGSSTGHRVGQFLGYTAPF